MIDFTQYAFNEVEREQKEAVSTVKAKVFMVIAFVLLGVVAIELLLFFILHFPKNLVWLYLIPNAIVGVGSIVMLFITQSLHKKLKSTGDDTKFTSVAKSTYLLCGILALSISFIFIGRIINPEFLAIL